LIINKDFIKANYILHITYPTKREKKPYIEGSKSDIRHGKTPYQEGRETKQHNYNTTTTTTTTATTTTQTTQTQTQIDTNFDHCPEENKSIHGN
jgi:hypothetical protein